MADKSAYAYFGRVFRELWTNPEKSWLAKVGTTALVFATFPLVLLGVLAYRGWKRFARR